MDMEQLEALFERLRSEALESFGTNPSGKETGNEWNQEISGVQDRVRGKAPLEEAPERRCGDPHAGKRGVQETSRKLPQGRRVQDSGRMDGGRLVRSWKYRCNICGCVIPEDDIPVVVEPDGMETPVCKECVRKLMAPEALTLFHDEEEELREGGLTNGREEDMG